MKDGRACVVCVVALVGLAAGCGETAPLHRLCGRVYQWNAGDVSITLSGTRDGAVTATRVSGDGVDAEHSSYCLAVPDGTYTVTPLSEGATFEPASVKVTVNGVDATAPDIDLICTIAGQISGPGASRADIGADYECGTAHHPRRCNAVLGSTDSAGAYSVMGTCRSYQVVRNASVFPQKGEYHYGNADPLVLTQRIDFDGRGKMHADFTSSSTISGQIDGVELGTCVTVRISGGVEDRQMPCHTRSGDDSREPPVDVSARYRFVVPDGTYTITLVPRDTEYGSPRSVTVEVRGDNLIEDFRVGGSQVAVSGHVAGIAPAGVNLTLSTATGEALATTSTDALGAFTFSGVAVGDYVVTPEAIGQVFEPTSTVVTLGADGVMGDVTGVSFVGIEHSGAAHAISGRLSGSTLEGVRMSITGPVSGGVLSNAAGGYLIDGLPDGTYTVTPSRDRYAFDPSSREVTVSGGVASGVDFTAMRGYSLRGRVSVPVSGYVSGVTITLTGDATDTTTTTVGGEFLFQWLRDGAYMLSPSWAEAVFSPGTASIVIEKADATQDFVSTGP